MIVTRFAILILTLSLPLSLAANGIENPVTGVFEAASSAGEDRAVVDGSSALVPRTAVSPKLPFNGCQGIRIENSRADVGPVRRGEVILLPTEEPTKVELGAWKRSGATPICQISTAGEAWKNEMFIIEAIEKCAAKGFKGVLIPYLNTFWPKAATLTVKQKLTRLAAIASAAKENGLIVGFSDYENSMGQFAIARSCAQSAIEVCKSGSSQKPLLLVDKRCEGTAENNKADGGIADNKSDAVSPKKQTTLAPVIDEWSAFSDLAFGSVTAPPVSPAPGYVINVGKSLPERPGYALQVGAHVPLGAGKDHFAKAREPQVPSSLAPGEASPSEENATSLSPSFGLGSTETASMGALDLFIKPVQAQAKTESAGVPQDLSQRAITQFGRVASQEENSGEDTADVAKIQSSPATPAQVPAASPAKVKHQKPMMSFENGKSLLAGSHYVPGAIWHGCADTVVRGGRTDGSRYDRKVKCGDERIAPTLANHIKNHLYRCVSRGAKDAGVEIPASILVGFDSAYSNRAKNTPYGRVGLSEHAYGRALDVYSFSLFNADGKRITWFSANKKFYDSRSKDAYVRQNTKFYDSFRLCWSESLGRCGGRYSSIGISGSTKGLASNYLHNDHIHLAYPLKCGGKQ